MVHSRLIIQITTVPQTLSFLRGQVGYIHARGFEVHAISSPGPRLDAFGRDEGVTTHAVEMPRRITPLHDIGALARLYRLLRRLRPTIVHAHTPKGGLLGMMAAWLARVPVRIYHVHGLPLMTAKGAKRRLLTWSERIACFCAHQVICVSPSVRQAAIDLKLCQPGKIDVLGCGTINGIDATGRFNPAALPGSQRQETRRTWGVPVEAPVVGFAGRIVRDKGVDDLVIAWGQLKNTHPDAHLVLAGVFEPQDPVTGATRTVLQDDPSIHLLGNVTDMPAFYQASDLLVLPTYREGFPYVPMEASAMALPVVATRAPGCVDAVIDGVTGTLVPLRDPAALAQAIARYLDDPDLRRQHGQAGRQRVLRDFRPEDIWEATYQEYIRLLRQQGLPIPEPTEPHP
jgi:glycosyltransferase involved in cell wall biosynthesis